MSEVPDGIGLLESRMNEMFAKADKFNEMTRHLKTMSILELMTRVDALEDKTSRASIFKRGNCSTGSVAQTKERTEGLDNAQLTIVQIVSELSEDFRESFRMVRAESITMMKEDTLALLTQNYDIIIEEFKFG